MLPVRFALLCAAGACLLAGSVRAESMVIDLQASWKNAGDRDATWTNGELVTVNGEFDEFGRFSSRVERDYESADTVWEMTLVRGVNREFASFAMTVTNTMATPQVFSFFTETPAAMAIAGPTQVITSTSLGVGDENANGAMLANDVGTAIYTASINGGVIDTLGDPLMLTAGPELTNSITQSNMFGGGPAVAMGDTLRIDMQFELSPGDTATFISTLAITPEPAGLTLLLAGGAVTLLRRRSSPQRV